MDAKDVQARVDDALKHTVQGSVHTIKIAGSAIYRGVDAKHAQALHNAASLGAAFVLLLTQTQPGAISPEPLSNARKRLKRTIAVRRSPMRMRLQHTMEFR